MFPSNYTKRSRRSHSDSLKNERRLSKDIQHHTEIDYADKDEFLEKEKQMMKRDRETSRCKHLSKFWLKTIGMIPMSNIQLYPFIFRGETKYGHCLTRMFTILCYVAYVSIFVVQTGKIGKFMNMEEKYINYETNFNLSSKYNDITPFTTFGEDGVEHRNLPFYFIENAATETCENYDKMEVKDKRKVALLVMQFADENDHENPKNVITPLKCRLDKQNDTIFEIDDENADYFMDVVNPQYVDQKK